MAKFIGSVVDLIEPSVVGPGLGKWVQMMVDGDMKDIMGVTDIVAKGIPFLIGRFFKDCTDGRNSMCGSRHAWLMAWFFFL